MEDYSPIDNERIEDILNSIHKDHVEGDKRLEALVREELTPRKKGEQINLFLRDEQKMIKFALKTCILFHSYDRRDIGKNLYSKHPIDVARTLLKYDVGNNIDYITIMGALLHDLWEEKKEYALGDIGTYLKVLIGVSDIKEKEKYYKDVYEKLIGLLTLLTQEEEENYNEYLKRIFSSNNERAIDIKVADRIPQSFDMKEKEYYGWRADLTDYVKHDIIKAWLGEEKTRMLKKKGGKLSEPLKQIGPEALLSLPLEDIIYLIFYAIYQNLEHLEIPGDRVLFAAYKDFRHIDYACNHINKSKYDPTLITLKNMLIISSMARVIGPRIEHLINGKHVSSHDILYADKLVSQIKESGELYKLTGYEEPLKDTDIIRPFYDPAMTGDKEMLRSLNDLKDKQYLHLMIWMKLFEKYQKDMIEVTPDVLKHRDLFTFNWGKRYRPVINNH